MAHVTLPITSRTSADDNDFADVYGNDAAIVTQVNGNLENVNIKAGAAIAYSKLALTGSIVAGDIGANAVTTAKILDEAVTGAKLAQDVVGVYRTIATASGGIGTDE